MEDDADDPMRTAFRQMRGIFAQLDRAMVLKRTRDGKRAKRAAGGFTGGPIPYGYKSVRRNLVPDQVEQAVITRMRRLRGEGYTYDAIAEVLNSDPDLPGRKRRWQHLQVHYMIDPDCAAEWVQARTGWHREHRP